MLSESAYKLRKNKVILQNKGPFSYKPTTGTLRLDVRLISSLLMWAHVRRQDSLYLLKHGHPTYRRSICNGQVL
jgi:hypothetical protein